MKNIKWQAMQVFIHLRRSLSGRTLKPRTVFAKPAALLRSFSHPSFVRSV